MAAIQAMALEQYESRRYGPLLGVSDAGGAAKTIADAAYRSAKAVAVGSPDASVVGMIIDGERMTSAGETPIGPDEYGQIVSAARGRTFCSTNVGTRVNTRLHQPFPEFPVAGARANAGNWLDKVFATFAPFVQTPDKKPRPLTVRLLLDPGESHAALQDLVRQLELGREAGKIGPASIQKLSFLIAYPNPIGSQLKPIEELIKVAADLGVPEVAVDGPLVEGARRRLSIQGLLNVLEPAAARSLLQKACEAKVRLTYRFEDDPESAARTVWTGLNSARACGLNAAKYGLTPLVFEHQQFVVEQVHRWITGWTAVPAFYVDTPLVTASDVIESDRCVEAAKLWMKMVSKAGAKVVLIDAPDRIRPRKLVQSRGGVNDPGVLSLTQIEELNTHAEKCGLRALWSGGIQADQAFQLAKFGVFGIFTTGSTAKQVAVYGPLVSDPELASASEPTMAGVRRIHALIQAGFLSRVLNRLDEVLAREIETLVNPLLQSNLTEGALESALSVLDKSLTRGWREYWKAE